MKTNVDIIPFAAIVGAQPADAMVSLQDADLLVEVRQPDAGGEARHSCTNNQNIIIHG
jgi:hypothetical protein